MIELTSLEYDSRLNAVCINARCSYKKFLSMVIGAESNLKIQRQIVKGSKAYATLRNDLRRGCVLPPIVLALKQVQVPSNFGEINNRTLTSAEEENFLAEMLGSINDVSPENVYIIDGLQRTNAIQQAVEGLVDEEKDLFLNHRVRLELWINIHFGALAYRMLLLNAGQKPMSIKHQIEILSMKLQEELSSIPGIDIITTADNRRRTQKGQFQLAKLAQSFQAWLQGQPNIDLRNIVMEQLLAETAIETLGASLEMEGANEESDAFRDYVTWLTHLDLALPEENIGFLSNETVLQGIAAAVGSAEKKPTLQERKNRALERLLTSVQEDPNLDSLGIRHFETLRQGIDPSRVNVGQATRDMVYGAFREYFLSDGTKSMEDCWQFAAG